MPRPPGSPAPGSPAPASSTSPQPYHTSPFKLHTSSPGRHAPIWVSGLFAAGCQAFDTPPEEVEQERFDQTLQQVDAPAYVETEANIQQEEY